MIQQHFDKLNSTVKVPSAPSISFESGPRGDMGPGLRARCARAHQNSLQNDGLLARARATRTQTRTPFMLRTPFKANLVEYQNFL